MKLIVRSFVAGAAGAAGATVSLIGIGLVTGAYIQRSLRNDAASIVEAIRKSREAMPRDGDNGKDL